MIDNIMFNEIDACLIQETWLTGEWEKEIRGFLVIHHHHEKKKEKKSKKGKPTKDNEPKKRGREKHGVAIILSPRFKHAYERTGRPKPITTSQKANTLADS